MKSEDKDGYFVLDDMDVSYEDPVSYGVRVRLKDGSDGIFMVPKKAVSPSRFRSLSVRELRRLAVPVPGGDGALGDGIHCSLDRIFGNAVFSSERPAGRIRR